LSTAELIDSREQLHYNISNYCLKGVISMDMLEQLEGYYVAYDEMAAKVSRETKGMRGIWGMGEDPRNHPCHERFYYQIEGWVASFLETQPESTEVAKAAKFILEAASLRRDQDSFWFVFAAQSHVVPMISWMSPQECAELAAWYDTKYTKLERLPAQRNMYKKLTKAAKGK